MVLLFVNVGLLLVIGFDWCADYCAVFVCFGFTCLFELIVVLLFSLVNYFVVFWVCC